MPMMTTKPKVARNSNVTSATTGEAGTSIASDTQNGCRRLTTAIVPSSCIRGSSGWRPTWMETPTNTRPTGVALAPATTA